MRAYSMGYAETMALPMRVFWQLSGQVERLQRDEARLKLELNTAATTPEAAVEMREFLNTHAPDPIKFSVKAQIEANSERDIAGFDELRSLAGA